MSSLIKLTEDTEIKQSEMGAIQWRSPSNIALIKYWGKHGDQLPQNPSLSLTLTYSHTTTEVEYKQVLNGRSSVDFLFDGHLRPDFSERVERYLDRIVKHFPILTDYAITIRSENSFPHSAGIASSASAMSALALSMCSIAYRLMSRTEDAEFWNVASHLSRLGSGSACRSVYGPVAVWGATSLIAGSSDHYAVPVTNVHPVFDQMRDTILIVDSGPKKVSSSEGHALMNGHPYAETRFAQARNNIAELLTALEQGNLERFMEITESEALALHAMMMTSNPSFILMKPGTLNIIRSVKRVRKEEGLPVCFTLDAGPNVHLLYPDGARDEVKRWIDAELTAFCKDGQMIDDVVGQGPEKCPSE